MPNQPKTGSAEAALSTAGGEYRQQAGPATDTADDREKNATACSIRRPVQVLNANVAVARPRRNAGGMVKYIPPFDMIRRSVEISTIKGELRVNVSYEDFINLLKTMLAGIEVDEEWYLATYEDIGRAVREGRVKSAKQHFIDDGYFEGRMPFPITIDERWYLQHNPDVAESIRRGIIESGQAHFQEDGYREGRMPFSE